MRAAVVVVALFGLSACGSAHRTRSSYSVKRVVSSFTANGVALHMAPWTCSTGFVCLDNGDGVQAYVFVGPKPGIQVSTLTLQPAHQTQKANLTVTWEGRYNKQVRNALRSLR